MSLKYSILILAFVFPNLPAAPISKKGGHSVQDYSGSDFLKYQIEADPKACLATNSKNNCILTIEEFNLFSLIAKNTNNVDIDTTRELVLKQSLEMKFLDSLVESSGYQDQALEQNKQFYFEKIRQNNAVPRKNKFFSELELKRVYKKYFNSKFKKSTRPVLALIVSTNESFIDSSNQSIINIREQFKNNDSLFVHFITDTSNSTFWEWPSFQNIPSQIVSKFDSLNPCHIIRGKLGGFGNYIAILVKRETLPAISFEEAIPTLRGLALLEDEETQNRAYNYYTEHLNNFRNNSIDSLKYWVVPISKSKFSNYTGEITKVDTLEGIRQDTVLNAGAITLMHDFKYSEFLNYFLTYNFGTVIGPLKTEFGLIYVRPISKNRISTFRRYSEVKDSLISVFANIPPSIVEQYKPEIKNAYEKYLNGYGYWNQFVSNQNDPSNSDIDEKYKNLELQNPGKNFSKTDSTFRNEVIQQIKHKQAESVYNNWLQNITPTLNCRLYLKVSSFEKFKY
jgi:hypothetical protein